MYREEEVEELMKKFKDKDADLQSPDSFSPIFKKSSYTTLKLMEQLEIPEK